MPGGAFPDGTGAVIVREGMCLIGVFLPMIHDIRSYGAIADGSTLATASIQKAIDEAAAGGGGRVIVPAGTFLTGTISLRSRVTLVLEQGAVLRGSPRLGDYRDPQPWPWTEKKSVHLVQAVDAEHVAITGEGTIAGSGPAFWHPDRPTEWDFWREKDRPQSMVRFLRCRHVRVEHVTLTESPGWTLHLDDCEAALVTGLTIRNSYFGPNTDGMDISNCRGVIVSDCDIATGDDAIALMASRYGGPSEDIAISNCIVRTSCVGLRIIGFDAQAVHRRISATNLVMPRTSRLVDVRSMNGALIEHVSIAGVVGTTNSGWPFNRPFEIVATVVDSEAWNLPDAAAIGRRPGRVRDVSLRDFDIVTDGRCIIGAQGPHEVSGITISDLRLRYAMLDDPQPVGPGAEDPLFFPGREHGDVRGARAALVVKAVRGLTVRNLDIRWPEYPVAEEWHLLRTPHRFISASVYRGHEEEIRAGRQRPTFKALWARELSASRLDLGGLTDSEGGPAVDEGAVSR